MTDTDAFVELFANLITLKVLDPRAQNADFTREILRCLLLVHRRPTIQELALIAELPAHPDGPDDNDERTWRDMISRCGGFVRIADDNGGGITSLVEWIHPEAREHLRKSNDLLSPEAIAVQHGVIALRCFHHVQATCGHQRTAAQAPEAADDEIDSDGEVEDVVAGHGVLHEEDEAGTDKAMDPRDKDAGDGKDQEMTPKAGGKRASQPSSGAANQTKAAVSAAGPPATAENNAGTADIAIADLRTRETLSYAIDYWPEHARAAPHDIVAEFDLADAFWGDAASPARAAWWRRFNARTPHRTLRRVTPLHIAVLCRFPALVERLLADATRRRDVHTPDSWGLYPLHWAARLGDRPMAEMLIEGPGAADVNRCLVFDGPPPVGMPPLWMAAVEGQLQMVRYLLEKDARVNIPDGDEGTPLYAAAAEGYVDIVKLLLEHHADARLKGGEHRVPLNAAAYFGHEDVVRLLCADPPDADAAPDKGYKYGTALGAAARKGHLSIVKFLLERGWRANDKLGRRQHTALSLAAAYGHHEVVLLLLEKSPSEAALQQAFDAAAKAGSVQIVDALMALPTISLSFDKAFIMAAAYGRDNVLQQLRGGRDVTREVLSKALYRASDNERESTVEVLACMGADPDAEGKE